MDNNLIKLVSEKMKNIEKGDFAETCKISNIDIDKWEWPQGVGLYGMYLNYKKNGDKDIFDWIVNWFENNIEKGIPERNINTTAPMLTLAHIAEETGNKKYMDMCVDWVNWVMDELPRTDNGVFQHYCTGFQNDNQVWDDTLFMTGLFVAKMAQLLDDARLREEIEYQFLMHVRYLFDTTTGLWFHGYTFKMHDNFGRVLWGRGNCWITAGIPIFVELLPDMSPTVKRYLINVLECQVKALEKYQHESGLWHTVINDDTSYLETSASSGFAFGILKAVHMGIIDKKYEAVGAKAIAAIKEQIDADGTVKNVSYGTGVSRTADYYKNIPLCTMAYGQALTLLALNEYEG